MGMDVYGKAPTDVTGEYFRNNVWFWRPLWDYCCEVDPDLAAKVPYGHSNDGDGLNGKDSRRLAAKLREEIAAGRTAKYHADRDFALAALPDQECQHCQGTGKRNDKYVRGTCNACGGKGKVRPFETSYPFDLENVSKFAAFLDACGGFEIC